MRYDTMAFQKLNHNLVSKKESRESSKVFLSNILKRRTVRDFSQKPVPIDIITNAVRAAVSAPSGANKQPWHFTIVKDRLIKKEIRVAAEKEEKEFYGHRASDDWLEDLNQFKTDWKKPFLESAPYLITVFKKKYDIEKGKKKKNYYVNESVGIASGFLLVALHNAGLVALTHTPSPMNFLEDILDRPKNEKAVLLIPVGYPAEEAEVPSLVKKSFKKTCNIL